MTRTEENNEKIHSEFFITKRLAEHILQVEEVKDCYLVNLLNEFSEDELRDAHQQQRDLIEKYEQDFLIEEGTNEDGIFTDEYWENNNFPQRFLNDDDYCVALTNYIIEKDCGIIHDEQ